MTDNIRHRDRVDPTIWQRSDMRTALAARDIAMVFRLLQRSGVSQRRIAALTGQSQSEISEILGGRQVVSYDVLVRIADGLEVPRGHLGLAYDESTQQLVGLAVVDEGEADDRRLLARLAELAVGAPTTGHYAWAQPFLLSWGSGPGRIGRSDVARLAAITAQLRSLDYKHGGGACRDAVLAQVTWAQQLLRAEVAEDAVRPLHVAVADLHVLAGWTSFDLGLLGPARRHFARAVEHARFAQESSLVAKAIYCLARLHMHHGWGGQGIRLLQLGQVAAQQSGLNRAVGLIHANLAWAQALVGDAGAVATEIARASDEFGRAEDEAAPPWLTFFDAAELTALRGTAQAYLLERTPSQRVDAIERFSLSTALRELPMARSRAFEMIMLAWMSLENGDKEQALQAGHEAVDLAGQLRSQRVIDRFAPLRTSLDSHPGDEGLRDLAERIQLLTRPGRRAPRD